MTTTPFLGCKISLISKSEIRYEGILYTIDPKESTIALAKVRSYGTEDRPAERQVQPRDEVFEYIIFRAADIKDLIVDDPPASIAPGLADPAIIQAHSTSTSSAATFPSSTFPQMTSSSISTTPGQRSSVPAFSALSGAPTHVSGVPVSYNANSETTSRTSTPTPSQRKSPQHETVNQTNTGRITPQNRENKQFREQRSGGQHRYDNRRGGQQARRGGGGQQNFRQYAYSQAANMGSKFGANRQYNNYNRDNYNRDNYNRDYNSGQRRASNQSRRPPQQQRSAQNRPLRTKEPIKFDGDFDFDKAQKEFQELEEKMTNLKMDSGTKTELDVSSSNESSSVNEVVVANNNGNDKDVQQNESEQHFYDKGKSFFDNISCEALERSKGTYQRVDWKAERKLNSETFGVPMSFRRQGYRGGFYGGRGGAYRNSSRGYGSFGSR